MPAFFLKRAALAAIITVGLTVGYVGAENGNRGSAPGATNSGGSGGTGTSQTGVSDLGNTTGSGANPGTSDATLGNRGLNTPGTVDPGDRAPDTTINDRFNNPAGIGSNNPVTTPNVNPGGNQDILPPVGGPSTGANEARGVVESFDGNQIRMRDSSGLITEFPLADGAIFRGKPRSDIRRGDEIVIRFAPNGIQVNDVTTVGGNSPRR